MSSVDDVLDLIFTEQLYHTFSPDLALRVKESEPRTFEEAAKKADVIIEAKKAIKMSAAAVSTNMNKRVKVDGRRCIEIITQGSMNGESASFLRDTGSELCMVSAKFVKDEDYTNNEVSICLANQDSITVPLARVDVSCQYLEGQVTAGVLPELVYDFVVGNEATMRNRRFPVPIIPPESPFCESSDERYETRTAPIVIAKPDKGWGHESVYGQARPVDTRERDREIELRMKKEGLQPRWAGTSRGRRQMGRWRKGRDRRGDSYGSMFVQAEDCGRIIGRKGSMIHDLQNRSGCHIKVSRVDEGNGTHRVELTGSEGEVARAKQLIKMTLEDVRGKYGGSHGGGDCSVDRSRGGGFNDGGLISLGRSYRLTPAWPAGKSDRGRSI